MQKKSEDFSLEDAMALAKTPTGQQLLNMLQQSDPAAVNKAMTALNAGNYTEAARALSKLLTPEVEKLARELGG